MQSDKEEKQLTFLPRLGIQRVMEKFEETIDIDDAVKLAGDKIHTFLEQYSKVFRLDLKSGKYAKYLYQDKTELKQELDIIIKNVQETALYLFQGLRKEGQNFLNATGKEGKTNLQILKEYADQQYEKIIQIWQITSCMFEDYQTRIDIETEKQKKQGTGTEAKTENVNQVKKPEQFMQEEKEEMKMEEENPNEQEEQYNYPDVPEYYYEDEQKLFLSAIQIAQDILLLQEQDILNFIKDNKNTQTPEQIQYNLSVLICNQFEQFKMITWFLYTIFGSIDYYYTNNSFICIQKRKTRLVNELLDVFRGCLEKKIEIIEAQDSRIGILNRVFTNIIDKERSDKQKFQGTANYANEINQAKYIPNLLLGLQFGFFQQIDLSINEDNSVAIKIGDFIDEDNDEEFIIEQMHFNPYFATQIKEQFKQTNTDLKLESVKQSQYIVSFQCHLIEHISNLLKQSLKQLQADGEDQYIQKVKTILINEDLLGKEFYPASVQDVIYKMQELLLVDESNYILGKNSIRLFSKSYNDRDFTNLKELFEQVKCREKLLAILATDFNTYLQEQNLLNAVFTGEQEKKNIKDQAMQAIKFIISQLEYSDQLIKQAFSDNVFLDQQRQNSFRKIISENDKIPLYLAIFCDSRQRGNSKAVNKDKMVDEDKQIAADFENGIRIFEYMYERDMFLNQYKSFLCKRLLNGLSNNMEHENKFIQMLKLSAGQYSVKSIENMLIDIQNSEELCNELKQQGKANIMKVRFLTQSSWPIKDVQYFKFQQFFPKEIIQEFEGIQKYYLNKFPERFIVLNPKFGNAELNFELRDKQTQRPVKFILQVTVEQAIIIFGIFKLGLNTIQQLSGELKVQAEQIEQSLQTMLQQNLVVHNDQKLGELSVLRINPNFQSKTKLVKLVPTVRTAMSDKKAVNQENEAQKKELIKQRENTIEAEIVKLMKQSKQVLYKDMIQKLMENIKNFIPEMGMIKQRIENLIAREYIKRNEENKDMFIYIP